MRRTSLSARPVAEAMEERILHSADFTPLANAASGVLDARLHEAALGSADTAAVQRHEIVFVDAAVPDAARLVADLQAQRAAGRFIEIVRIDAGEDGIERIGATLAQRSDIAAVHVLAHGADGALQLGSATLDAQTLMQRADRVAAWGTALSADADLLLYGCDVAQTPHGERFVRDLAALTGADVAASDDVTGAAAMGGDWTLEYRAGQIRSASVVSAMAQARWQGVLATYTVTTTADQVGATKLVGSLRWAIDQANRNAGVDDIRFVGGGTYDMLAGSTGDDLNDAGDFDVYEGVNIIGNGAANTVINGNGADRVFDFHGTNISGANQYFFLFNGYDVNVSGLTIQNGGGVADGGGLRTDYYANMTLSRAVVQDNAAGSGGGISNAGTLALREVTVQRNDASARGGGISVVNLAELRALDLRVSENTAFDGGGIHVQGGLAYLGLTNATLDANRAVNGAGLYAQNGTVGITTSTISGNTASALGGGIYAGPATFNVRSSTLAFNTATDGGGVYASAAPPTFHNSLITSSTGGDSNVRLGSNGYNIANDNGTFGGATDMRDSVGNLKLQALAQNGGYAPTHALPSNSSAVDAGDPAVTYTDQREVARDGAAPDVGAYEFTGSTNLAPTIAYPGTISVFEEVATPVGGIAVNDANNGAGVPANELSSVALRVSPANGRISVGGPALISAGANNSATLTLSGTQSAINASLATLSYQGLPNYNGGDTLVITARDGAGGATTRSVGITVNRVNDAPHGTDSTVTVAMNGSRSFSRGDFGYGDAPGEGDGFVSVLLNVPSDGTLTVAGAVVSAPVEVGVGQLDAGEVVYRPFSGNAGNPYATLRFQVRDNGGTADAGIDLDPVFRTLNIDVTGSAALISSDGGGDRASVNVVENASGVTTVVASSTAPGAMTYGIDGGADAARFGIDAATGALRFVVAPDFESPADVGADNRYEVTVRATDALGGFDGQQLTVTVTDANEAPVVATALSDRAATQGSAVDFVGNAANLVDPDAGDALRYAATRVDGSALPGWLGFDSATGRFTGTPADADVGSLNIRLAAIDRAGARAFDDFALEVANLNDAPVNVAPIADRAVAQGAAFRFTLPTGAFTDADLDNGDTLRFAATRVDGAPLPAWLAFDPLTGEFTGTPADADVGAIGIRVTVTDDAGAAAFDDFVIDVVNANDAPVAAAPIATQAATQGTAFGFTVPANAFDDADLDSGDALRYTATLASGAALPSWLAFDAGSGRFTGTPADADVGAVTVRLTATDLAGRSASGEFLLGVANANDAPVLARAVEHQTFTQGAVFSFTLPAGSFTDLDTDNGDALRYTATLASGAPVPAWLRVDPVSGRFSGAPGPADAGVLQLRIVATDAAGAVAHSDFTLNVLHGIDAIPAKAEVAPAPRIAPAVDETPAPAPAPRPVADAAAPQASAATFTAAPRAAPDAPAPDAAPEPVRVNADEIRPGSHAVNRFGIEPGDAVPIAAAEGESTPVARVAANDEMRRRLDELRRQTAEEGQGAGGRTVVGSTFAVGGSLSVGYVVWLVRGGVLASSMLSALPAWQMIDPLPVVTAARKKGERDDDAADAPEVERLFKKHARAGRTEAGGEARVRKQSDSTLRRVRAALGAKP